MCSVVRFALGFCIGLLLAFYLHTSWQELVVPKPYSDGVCQEEKKNAR